MEVKAITDASGRVLVTLHDDSGRPYKFVSDAIPILGQLNFTEVLAIPLTKDDTLTPPRPTLVRGQIFLGAQIAFDAAALDYVLADVVVIGYVGSTGTVLRRAQLGANQDASLLRITFEADDTFDKIGVEARCIVNGQPSAAVANINQANISAVALMWS